MTRITCCEHNRCPDRPRWFLGRFLTRPWRCPQCHRWWVTLARSSYSEGEYLVWVETQGSA